MDDEYFWFDLLSSKDFEIRMRGAISISPAIPKVEKIVIPGRNGDLNYFDGSYKNRKIKIPCYILGSKISEKINRINNWLLKSQEYRELELGRDAQRFFLARPKGGVAEVVKQGIINSFDIEFDCRPERFLLSGKSLFTLFESQSGADEFNGTLNNPTETMSSPVFEIEISEKKSGQGIRQFTFDINGQKLIIGDKPFVNIPKKLVFDSRSGMLYESASAGVFLNRSVLLTESGLYKLIPGENKITGRGPGMKSFMVKPNWWEF